jgi:hypothetical protein
MGRNRLGRGDSDWDDIPEHSADTESPSRPAEQLPVAAPINEVVMECVVRQDGSLCLGAPSCPNPAYIAAAKKLKQPVYTLGNLEINCPRFNPNAPRRK